MAKRRSTALGSAPLNDEQLSPPPSKKQKLQKRATINKQGENLTYRRLDVHVTCIVKVYLHVPSMSPVFFFIYRSKNWFSVHIMSKNSKVPLTKTGTLTVRVNEALRVNVLNDSTMCSGPVVFAGEQSSQTPCTWKSCRAVFPTKEDMGAASIATFGWRSRRRQRESHVFNVRKVDPKKRNQQAPVRAPSTARR